MSQKQTSLGKRIAVSLEGFLEDLRAGDYPELVPGEKPAKIVGHKHLGNGLYEVIIDRPRKGRVDRRVQVMHLPEP